MREAQRLGEYMQHGSEFSGYGRESETQMCIESPVNRHYEGGSQGLWLMASGVRPVVAGLSTARVRIVASREIAKAINGSFAILI